MGISRGISIIDPKLLFNVAGTWLVGIGGHEQGSIWASLSAAYLFYSTVFYISDESLWISILATVIALSFNKFSKRVRSKPKLKLKPKPKPKLSISRRLGLFSIYVLIYSSLWASYFYFNTNLVRKFYTH